MSPLCPSPYVADVTHRVPTQVRYQKTLTPEAVNKARVIVPAQGLLKRDVLLRPRVVVPAQGLPEEDVLTKPYSTFQPKKAHWRRPPKEALFVLFKP